MRIMQTILVVILLALFTGIAMAAQPTIIALQGKLTNTTSGAIIYSATLRVNISDVNGITIWNQTYPNAVAAGFFDLLLGSDASNPLNLTYNEDYNISVYVGDSPTQIGGSFRFRSSKGQISPSNLSAGDFSASGTFTFGSTVTIDKTNNKVGIGTSTLSRLLTIAGDMVLLGNLNATIVNATIGNFSRIGLLDGSTIWHSSNDGAGSGLDADVLDGADSTLFSRVADAFNFANNLSAILDNNTIIRAGNLSSVVRTADAFNAANFTSNFATHNATSGLWNGTSTAIYPRSITALVGLGTNTPLSTLHVNGSGAAGGFRVTNESGYTTFFVNSTLGNVGIGTVNATEKLTIEGGNFLQKATSNPRKLSNLSDWRLETVRSVFVQDDYAYLAGGFGNSTVIIDVSDPRNPMIVGSVNDSSTLKYADDIYVSGKYAYVVASSVTGATTADYLAVLDVSNVSMPKIISNISSTSYLDDATDIVVSGPYAYIAADQDDMLSIYDISNPYRPTLAGFVTDSAAMNGPSALFVSGNYVYVSSSTGDSLAIADVSNPSSPRIVGNISSSTYMDSASSVYVSGRYAYMTGSGSDTFTVIDVSNVTAPTIVSSISSSTRLDAAREISIAGDYAYVAVQTDDAITVIDISNATDPRITGFYSDTSLDGAWGISVVGKYAYVASATASSLTIIDLDGIKAPLASIGNVQTDAINVEGNAVIAGNAFVGTGLTVGDLGIKTDGSLGVKGDVTAFGTLRINNTVFFVNATSTNVGIGTTNPKSKLTVAGDVNLTDGGDLILSNAVAGYSSTFLYNDFGDLYVNNNGWAITLNPNAFMPTINTSSPGSGAIAKNLTIASEDGSVIVQLG